MSEQIGETGLARPDSMRSAVNVLCILFGVLALVCCLFVFYWLLLLKQIQHTEQTISAMSSAAERLFHASVTANGAELLPHMTHSHDHSGSENGEHSDRSRLTMAIRQFRKVQRELTGIFEPARASAAGFFDEPTKSIALRAGLRSVPSDVQTSWVATGTGQTLGQVLKAQLAACLTVCAAPSLSPEERKAALERMQSLTLDVLLPGLDTLRASSAAWQDRTNQLAQITIGVAFLLILLAAGIARWKMMGPLIRRLDQATLALQDQNANLEERIAARTSDLQMALEEVKAAAAARTSFLANISHELRTPMNGVLGVAALLRTTKLDNKQSQFLGAIESSGKHLIRLIDDLLDSASVATGNLRILARRMMFEDLIQDCLALQTPVATLRGLALSCDLSEAPGIPVIADPDRLRQILLNLIGNAIKYTPEGLVEVRLCERREGEQVFVRVDVTDTGLGIPPEDRARVFEPFERLDDLRKVGGTGLGLALCKSILNEMGGQLTLESTPGVGSCFSISLELPFADAVGSNDTVDAA